MRGIRSTFTFALAIAFAGTFSFFLTSQAEAAPQDGLPVVPMPTVPRQGTDQPSTEQQRQALLRFLRAQQSKVDPRLEKLLQENIQRLQKRDAEQTELQRKQAAAGAKKMIEMMRQMGNGSQGNRQMLGNLPLPEPRTKSAARAKASTKLIQIRLHLTKLNGVDGPTLGSLRKGLAESDFASFRGAVAELQDQLAFEFQNEMFLTAIDGQMSELTLGSQVPVKTGALVTRGGQKVYNYDQMETGLRLTIVPKIVGEAIRLELDLSKSYLNMIEPDEDDSFNTTQVETFECVTATAVKNGRITMISLSEGEEVWLITVAAMALN